MKKVMFLVVLFIFNINIISASERIEVRLNKCVDGDTAWFIIGNETIKTRFLAIDTPESTNKTEAYGKEASTYTCDKLKNASKIEIEYDDNSDKKDKYDRDLVWVFVDNELLQNLIVKEGLAEVSYLYGDYKYTDTLKQSEEIAKSNNLNIWGDYKESTPDYLYIIILAIVVIIICIFSKKSRNKVINKVKKNIKKEVKKQVKLK